MQRYRILFLSHLFVCMQSKKCYLKVYLLQRKINTSSNVTSVARLNLKLITREPINFSVWIKTVHTMPVEVCVGCRGPCMKVSRKLVLAIIFGRTRIFRIEWMRIAMIPCSRADIHPNNSFQLARALVFYQLRKIVFLKAFFVLSCCWFWWK